jgi:peroxiredoxin
MKRCKWHTLLVLGLALVSLGSAVACIPSQETSPAPDFSLQSINGETINLVDFRGQPVMLIFWQIHCPACQSQMPFTQALYDKWSNDSFAILTIDVGDRASDIENYVNDRGITYPVLLDSQTTVAEDYGIYGVPTTYFIDGQGDVKGSQIGAFRNENEMENALSSAFPSLALNSKTETSPPIITKPTIKTSPPVTSPPITPIPKTRSAPQVGNIAPDFTLQNIDSQKITLSDFRGKSVLLNFWMSSCDACVSELPYLQTVSDNLTDQKTIIIAINCGESSQTVHSVVDRLKPSFPVLLDPEGTVCAAYKRGAPTAFLIDSNGIIKAIKDDAFESSGEVASMLYSLQ